MMVSAKMDKKKNNTGKEQHWGRLDIKEGFPIRKR